MLSHDASLHLVLPRDFRPSRDKAVDRGERRLVNIEDFQRSCCLQSSCLTQIGFGVLVATSTAKRVAVLRTLPAIVISASVMGLCCSASPSRRVLMSWS